ncbi:sulfatase-like hydrolase/transferase [Streptomyces sp. NPDC004044]
MAPGSRPQERPGRLRPLGDPPEHGVYHDPVFLTRDGARRYPGYVTDIITDLALDRLDKRDPDKPFALLIQHKAPHRAFEPAERHRHLYEHQDIPAPATLHDEYSNRSRGLSEREERDWRYQHDIKEYLRVVAGLDENVARVLHYLDITDTAVAYPEINPTGWNNAKATTPTVDYLAPAFLKEVEHWYAAVMPVIAERLHREGRPGVIACQLDNEIGMLAWVSNSPDLTDHLLADFNGWLDTTYGGAARAACGVHRPQGLRPPTTTDPSAGGGF